MNATEPFEDSLTGMEWLGTTTLETLGAEVERRIRAALEAGAKQGYLQGQEAGRLEAEGRLDKELKKQLAEREAEFARVAERDREAALAKEDRLLEGFARERATWVAERAEEERMRAEASLREAEERVKAFDRTIREREKAIEERLRNELLADAPRAAVREKPPEPSFMRSSREAPILKSAHDLGKVDVVRKQAFQNGFEQGLTKGRRDAEAEVQTRIRDAKRQGYAEGLTEGRRASLGIEGSRSWALGVMHLPDEASTEEVRQRFRKLSLLLHPDQNPGIGDGFIKNLNRARDVLGG